MDDPKIDIEPKQRGKRTSKYKIVRLYNAETGKSTTTSVKIADFATLDELNLYCQKLKDDRKAKNLEIKNQRSRDKIEAVLEGKPFVDTVERVTQVMPINGWAMEAVKYSDGVNLRLDKGTGNTTIIFGSSKHGKTTLMMYLYNKYYSNYIPSRNGHGTEDKKKASFISTLFSGNPQLKIYRDDKNLLTTYGFSPEHAKYIKMQQYINVKTKNRYNFLNLFDDIIDAKYSRVINQMILSYRNSNISMIMCLQGTKLLSRQNRSNVNNTIIFGSNTNEEAEDLVKLILKPYFINRGMSKLSDMITFYKMVTANYGFIYIDNLKSTISFHRLTISKPQPQ